MRTRILLLVFLLCTSAPASPQKVKVDVRFNGGRVTIHAVNAPLAAILDGWAREGGTRIVVGGALEGHPVTLDLKEVPERQAIETLFAGMAGYVFNLRGLDGPAPAGRSEIARIHLLPVSRVAPSAAPKQSAEAMDRVPVDSRQPSAGFRLNRAPGTEHAVPEQAASELEASSPRLTGTVAGSLSSGTEGERPMRLRQPPAAPLSDQGSAIDARRLATPQPARPPR